MTEKNHLKILAEEWIEKGTHDLDTARREFKYGGWEDIICFHCQQAIEKYLKAYLTSCGINIGKLRKWQIHDLSKLVSECQKLDSDFQIIKEGCFQLNPYYIESRYPLGVPKVYSQEETKKAIEIVEYIVEFIKRKIT